MRRLFVLYDAGCGLCSRVRRWAEGQTAYVPLEFIRSDDPAVARRYPGLKRRGLSEELIVIGDDGSVYRESHAWLMCLYALEEYREWAFRLSRPALMPLAREAFHLLS